MGIRTKNMAGREREKKREREIETEGDYAPKMEDGNHTWATWVIWSRNMNFQIIIIFFMACLGHCICVFSIKDCKV